MWNLPKTGTHIVNFGTIMVMIWHPGDWTKSDQVCRASWCWQLGYQIIMQRVVFKNRSHLSLDQVAAHQIVLNMWFWRAALTSGSGRNNNATSVLHLWVVSRQTLALDEKHSFTSLTPLFWHAGVPTQRALAKNQKKSLTLLHLCCSAVTLDTCKRT